MLTRRELPIASLREAAPFHAHDLSGPDFVHAGIDRAFGILREHKNFAKAILADARLHAGVSENRLGLGAEQQAIGRWVVEKRLHAHAVANEIQLFGSNVPDREREHSIEPIGNFVTPLKVSPEHDFRVAAGLESVAEPR